MLNWKKRYRGVVATAGDAGTATSDAAAITTANIGPAIRRIVEEAGLGIKSPSASPNNSGSLLLAQRPTDTLEEEISLHEPPLGPVVQAPPTRESSPSTTRA
jgi:hypothetical protein